MKRFMLMTVLIVAITIGGTGCMFNNKPNQNVNDLALEYLENKYGESFEYCTPAGSSYTGTRRFSATCESIKNYKVYVQIDNYKSENRVIRDNYIEAKYADQMRAYLKQIVDKEFAESKVFYRPSGRPLSNDLPADATFDEYISHVSGCLPVVIGIKKSDYQCKDQLFAIIDEVSSTFAANTIAIKIYVVEDSEYTNCTEDSLRTIGIKDAYYVKAVLNRINGNTSSEYIGGDK